MNLEIFTEKDKMFCKDGIMKLPQKWQKAEKENSKYVDQ